MKISNSNVRLAGGTEVVLRWRGFMTGMAVAFATLLVATIKQTGGFNGLNTFTTFFGQDLYNPAVPAGRI